MRLLNNIPRFNKAKLLREECIYEIVDAINKKSGITIGQRSTFIHTVLLDTKDTDSESYNHRRIELEEYKKLGHNYDIEFFIQEIKNHTGVGNVDLEWSANYYKEPQEIKWYTSKVIRKDALIRKEVADYFQNWRIQNGITDVPSEFSYKVGENSKFDRGIIGLISNPKSESHNKLIQKVREECEQESDVFWKLSIVARKRPFSEELYAPGLPIISMKGKRDENWLEEQDEFKEFKKIYDVQYNSWLKLSKIEWPKIRANGMTCPNCNGVGGNLFQIDWGDATYWSDCGLCDSGKVYLTFEDYKYRFSPYLKKEITSVDSNSLKEACERHNLDKIIASPPPWAALLYMKIAPKDR